MPELVGYLLLFLTAAVGFIFVHLVAGKLVRPARPGAEKGTAYECGEPTVGDAWVQFDLRFYVVALLFVIFDVEVAFFFPWAVVFGTASELARPDLADVRRVELTVGPVVPTPGTQPLVPPYAETEAERAAFREVLKAEADPSAREQARQRSVQAASRLTWLALGELMVFFGVLLVGFAYLWRRGDLEWVRGYQGQAIDVPAPEPTAAAAVAP